MTERIKLFSETKEKLRGVTYVLLRHKRRITYKLLCAHRILSIALMTQSSMISLPPFVFDFPDNGIYYLYNLDKRSTCKMRT